MPKSRSLKARSSRRASADAGTEQGSEARTGRLAARVAPRPHRAVRRLDFPATRWLTLLLLPPLFNALFWCLRDDIGAGWQAFFALWLAWLDLPGTITMEVVRLPADLVLRLPVPHVPAVVPDTTIWLATLAATVAILAASFRIGDQYVPLRYLLRLVVVIQITALLCFAIFPATFPYTANSHMRDGLLLSTLLLVITPWLHALIYYVFGFSLLQKVALTGLTLIYFLVMAPVQYLLHAWLLHHLSLMALPILYLLFGVLLDMLMLIALYAWAMSWPCRESLTRKPS